jgi:hypothetical protein
MRNGRAEVISRSMAIDCDNRLPLAGARFPGRAHTAGRGPAKSLPGRPAGRPVRIQCAGRRRLIATAGSVGDAALDQPARLAPGELPVPCELCRDERTRTWQALAR